MSLDTLNLFYTIAPFRKMWVQIAPTKPSRRIELLFFQLKSGEEKKKSLHIRRATVFLLKSIEDQKKRSSRPQGYCFPTAIG